MIEQVWRNILASDEMGETLVSQLRNAAGVSTPDAVGQTEEDDIGLNHALQTGREFRCAPFPPVSERSSPTTLSAIGCKIDERPALVCNQDDAVNVRMTPILHG